MIYQENHHRNVWTSQTYSAFNWFGDVSKDWSRAKRWLFTLVLAFFSALIVFASTKFFFDQVDASPLVVYAKTFGVTAFVVVVLTEPWGVFIRRLAQTDAIPSKILASAAAIIHPGLSVWGSVLFGWYVFAQSENYQNRFSPEYYPIELAILMATAAALFSMRLTRGLQKDLEDSKRS
jgi:hypothetical protein